MRLPLADAVVSELNLYNRGIIPSMQGRISAPMKSDIKAKCILPHGNHIKNTKPCRAERRRLKSVYARNTKKNSIDSTRFSLVCLLKKFPRPPGRQTVQSRPGKTGAGMRNYPHLTRVLALYLWVLTTGKCFFTFAKRRFDSKFRENFSDFSAPIETKLSFAVNKKVRIF